MQTVTFAREYRHRIDDLHTAIYPAGAKMTVEDDIAAAARRAKALKEEDEDEQRPVEGD